VQILLHGGTYGREYWDFQYQPEKYSYVRYANKQGYATLNYDQLGIGRSDRPAPELATYNAQIRIVDHLVKQLRSGGFGWQADKVVLIGHSGGSTISSGAAGLYHGVDGVVLTGLTFALPRVFMEVSPTWQPAFLDPDPRFKDLPPGYLAPRPGTRPVFYHMPNADPGVLAHDEATKEVIQSGYVATIMQHQEEKLGITAPVLTILGEKDQLMCPTGTCSDPLSLAEAERAFFPQAPSYDLKIVPDAAHNLTLQKNAQDFFDVMNEWISTHVG
jgi:pimeloyl-ACP methyl ester carboxylesterase